MDAVHTSDSEDKIIVPSQLFNILFSQERNDSMNSVHTLNSAKKEMIARMLSIQVAMQI